jgi:RNA:NAD 2'-phosphotransferase (TPT1/KptA family)
VVVAGQRREQGGRPWADAQRACAGGLAPRRPLLDLTTLSKTISRILRRRPDAAGHGWCTVDDLLRGLALVGTPATRKLLEQVVRENDKKRFDSTSALAGERPAFRIS